MIGDAGIFVAGELEFGFLLPIGIFKPPPVIDITAVQPAVLSRRSSISAANISAPRRGAIFSPKLHFFLPLPPFSRPRSSATRARSFIFSISPSLESESTGNHGDR